MAGISATKASSCASSSCNLRRDYDVRLRNPMGNDALLPTSGEVSALRHIDSGRRPDRIACRKRQLFGQRLLNSFRVANLIVMGRYLRAQNARSAIRAESVLIALLLRDNAM